MRRTRNIDCNPLAIAVSEPMCFGRTVNIIPNDHSLFINRVWFEEGPSRVVERRIRSVQVRESLLHRRSGHISAHDLARIVDAVGYGRTSTARTRQGDDAAVAVALISLLVPR